MAIIKWDLLSSMNLQDLQNFQINQIWLGLQKKGINGDSFDGAHNQLFVPVKNFTAFMSSWTDLKKSYWT